MILYHLRDGTVSGAIVGLNECTGRLLVLLTLVAVELKNSSLFSLYQNFLQCQTKLQQRAPHLLTPSLGQVGNRNRRAVFRCVMTA